MTIYYEHPKCEINVRYGSQRNEKDWMHIAWTQFFANNSTMQCVTTPVIDDDDSCWKSQCTAHCSERVNERVMSDTANV